MKKIGYIIIFLVLTATAEAQSGNCTLKPPQITIDFGTGYIPNPNTANLHNYRRISGFCPSDGHYAFVPYTAGCFRDDWHTITEDHTPGDVNGNMLLVNAAPYGGVFLSIPVDGLKPNTTYQLALWVMNLCRPTKKCPSVLLPSLSIRLETPEGKLVANIVTRELQRVATPQWTRHYVMLTTPANTANLRLVMADNAPGGCGNDFALDDITFSECVKTPAQSTAAANKQPAQKQIAQNQAVKKTVAPKPTSQNQSSQKSPAPKPATQKPTVKKTTSETKPVVNKSASSPDKTPATIVQSKSDSSATKAAQVRQPEKIKVPVPPVLRTRTNELYKSIETVPGEIKISLYDNGEIDGDTVSIYHNNRLIKSRQMLSAEAITITLQINEDELHHEIVMVAENLGSIPPNTSVMVINTPTNRYEVFISSNTQKNAKVVFSLKK